MLRDAHFDDVSGGIRTSFPSEGSGIEEVTLSYFDASPKAKTLEAVSKEVKKAGHTNATITDLLTLEAQFPRYKWEDRSVIALGSSAMHEGKKWYAFIGQHGAGTAASVF